MTKPRFESLVDGRYRLAGELSFATVPALMTESASLFSAGKDVTLLLDGVERIDSAGLALMISLVRQAHKHGQALSLEGVPDQMLGLARVGGVEHILALSDA